MSKPKIILGIDPGVSGGVAFLCGTHMGHFPLDFDDFRTRLSDGRWTDEHNVIAYLEKQWLWKNERDVKTANVLVCNFCMIKGMLFMAEIPYIEVPPVTWQLKVLGKGEKGTTKKRSLKFALEEYGKELKSGQDGEADAIALAHYGSLQR